jgi:hypothetical protein
MLTAIDHFIVACADPDGAAALLEAEVGLTASAGGRHELHGTFNRLIWLGDSYIELMGVFDRQLAEASWFGSHALLVIDRSGNGQMGLVLASDDLVADHGSLSQGGSALGEPETGERVRPDGRIVRWRLAHPSQADLEIGLVFLIEHDYASAEWTEAERAERAAQRHALGGPARLTRIELAVDDMHLSTMRLHRDMGVAFRPSLAGGGARDGAVGRQTLRLIRADAESIPAVVVRGGPERRESVALGCRWLVEPEPP